MTSLNHHTNTRKLCSYTEFGPVAYLNLFLFALNHELTFRHEAAKVYILPMMFFIVSITKVCTLQIKVSLNMVYSIYFYHGLHDHGEVTNTTTSVIRSEFLIIAHPILMCTLHNG